jgi:DNA-binding response OmpR family regulator
MRCSGGTEHIRSLGIRIQKHEGEMQATVPSLALLVENDQLQRDFLSDVLKEQNFDVIECDSAEAAELIVARCGAELTLVVTDFALAGVGNGADFAALTREMFPYLPILVVSDETRVAVAA